jgi:hypothetical protein
MQNKNPMKIGFFYSSSTLLIISLKRKYSVILSPVNLHIRKIVGIIIKINSGYDKISNFIALIFKITKQILEIKRVFTKALLYSLKSFETKILMSFSEITINTTKYRTSLRSIGIILKL